MGIKLDGASVNRVLTLLGSANEDIESAVAEAYAEVGEYVTEGIRSGTMSNWQDQSGSLRSSIGYVVARKGRIVKSSGFEVVLNGSAGAAKGRELAARLASENSQYDFCLIIVAGEEYAVYVEAVEGKVVLAEGQLYVEQETLSILRRKVKQVLNKYENRR